MKSFLKFLLLKVKYGKLNSFSRDVYNFSGRSSMVEEKFDFLEQYSSDLKEIDIKLYCKLSNEDKQTFVLWILKRWCFIHNRLMGGGGKHSQRNMIGYCLKLMPCFLRQKFFAIKERQLMTP
ncbi:hypothetical protein [Helicobacter bilis]|uniref:hypothetical protein n=1 Tax=Helicobacter bilis TaxID=37372 RepID=UPI002941F67D|nr:hypothetical protein [Helicobacter bilis]